MNEYTLMPGGAVAQPPRKFVLPTIRLPLRNDLPPCDPPLVLAILTLSLLGLPLLYSASYAVSIAQYHNHFHYVLHQLPCVAVGLALMGFFSKWNLDDVRARTPFIFGFTLMLLLLVLGIGSRSGEDHVRRWMRLGPMSFQPSECAKFATILMLAYVISQLGPGAFRHWIDWAFVSLFIGPVLLLVFIEPHLSATLLIAATSTVMLFVAGATTRNLLCLGLLALLALGGVYGAVQYVPPLHKFNYMIARIKGHRGVDQEAQDSQYQPRHSTAALKRGGLFGVGFCNGRGKLLYMPAPQNDFIFAVIGEEWGLLGSLVMLSLFGWLIVRCCHVAFLTTDYFASLVCTGVATLIALQVAINVGVATALIPTTGVSLPFVSSGGSGLVMLLSALGLVLNASRTIKKRP